MVARFHNQVIIQPPHTEVAEEALQLRKSLGISMISDETLAVKRITKNLRKDWKTNDRQETYVLKLSLGK